MSYREEKEVSKIYKQRYVEGLEQKDNWDHLHTLCDTLAGKADIWYATNMEIYQYVTAYRSLIYSADGRTIYNPTLLTLWFDRDGVLYAIKPGEQLTV